MSKKIMISIDENLLKILDLYSDNLHISRSAFIRIAILEYLSLHSINSIDSVEDSNINK